MNEKNLGKTLCEIFAQDKRTAAREARNAALDQVESNADREWLNRAADALRQYLTHHETMFVDDFWEWTQLDRPRESRALGPVFVRAAHDGLMKKTGGYRNSIASKMGPKPIWRSLIYNPNAVPHRPPMKGEAQGELF
jgi:hypothetical protein